MIKQNITLVVISYEIFETRRRLVSYISYEMVTSVRSSIYRVPGHAISWLVGCFGLNGPLRQYFSLYRAVSKREGEWREK